MERAVLPGEFGRQAVVGYLRLCVGRLVRLAFKAGQCTKDDQIALGTVSVEDVEQYQGRSRTLSHNYEPTLSRADWALSL